MATLEDSCLIVQVLLPGISVSTVRVRSTDQCGVLDKVIEGRTCSFLYQGEILNPTQEFSFYDIKNSETIIAVPETNRDADNDRRSGWMRVSWDGEDLNARIGALTSPVTRPEALRLRDLALKKGELYGGKNSGLSGRRLWSSTPVASLSRQRTIIPNPASDISTEELPKLW
jgi:hypothetical protein